MIQLLGQKISIIASTNTTFENLSGVVVDETKHSLVLKTTRGQKRVVKHTILFTLGGDTIVGKTICSTPQDRLKLKWKQK